MLFREFYGAYYNTVARILSRAIAGTLTEKDIYALAAETAFSESGYTIADALKSERWQLLLRDMRTPLAHVPTMPLSLLEKRWLKAISLDPRVRLFDCPFPDLADVEPLFVPEDCVVFDRYSDGDDFESPTYIRHFRTVLAAVRTRTPLCVDMENRNGKVVRMYLIPDRLEYSEKDDKFRLIAAGGRYPTTVNIGRICDVFPAPDAKFRHTEQPSSKRRELVLELLDERNAMERAMLHFAHFEKVAKRCGENLYRMHVFFDAEDETELLIRVLSFGPFVKVIEPDSFVSLIRERLLRQQNCGL